MLRAPSNEYEHMRAGMEYKLALQAIRKIVRVSKGSDYEVVKQIADVIHSMEEDVRRRDSDNGGEGRLAAEPAEGNDQPLTDGKD